MALVPSTTAAEPHLVQAVIVDGTNAISMAQVSLQIDGTNVPAAVVTRTGAQTTVTYRPNPLFPPKSQHTATLLFQDGSNPVSRTWQFTVAAYTKDKLHNYFGTFREKVTYSSNAGGHSANAGDYAIDFGRDANGGIYIKHAGDFLNMAGTNNEMSFSLWIKKYDIAASSAFWANAPSASGSRAWQAHTPWSDDTIYFDTAGPNNFERISTNITSFVGYTGNDGWWTNWHHFLFSKNVDTKQIWIDGQFLVDGTTVNPLPTDFTDMYLGSGDGGGANMHGQIDDFAVYGTALGTNDIILLSGGSAPTALS